MCSCLLQRWGGSLSCSGTARERAAGILIYQLSNHCRPRVEMPLPQILRLPLLKSCTRKLSHWRRKRIKKRNTATICSLKG